jgi:ring-1,2-phenylacetyl-CoA epoxidase subunit PaaE
MDINQLQWRIHSINRETADAWSYTLEEVNGKQVSYKAGQFLTLLLQIDGKEVRRSYSISSAPGVDKRISITVNRVVNGLASRYIIDHFHVGQTITTLAPAGKFTVDEDASTLFFIVAGSGITPVFSLIKYVLQFNASQKIVLINQNRHEDSAVFRKTLQLLQNGYNNRFSIIELFSQPTSHFMPPQRLNNYVLEQIVYKLAPHERVSFYICGPKAFMLMAEFTLKTIGYSDAMIRKENFEINPVALVPVVADKSPHQVTALYNDASTMFETTYPQNILQAALSNNIQLPYSCRGGRCSSCMVKLLSGKVFMSMNEVLTEKDLVDGWILTCVGFAESDIILQIPSPG